MKHQNLIDKFRARKDENDGVCDIIYLPSYPGAMFENALPGPCTDIIYAALAPDGRLSFLTSDPTTADRVQQFVGLGELPFSVQKNVYNYLFS